MGTSAYIEFNASPSGEWASYLFDGYREGMRPAVAGPGEAGVFVLKDGFILEVTVGLDLEADFGQLASGSWSVGLSAVVEEANGCLSYWALAHSVGKPDFHHPDCFTLELPPPD